MLNIPNTEVIKVSRFQFDKNQPEQSHHLAQLSNNSKLSHIFKIKSLVYQRVKWEHLKEPKLFQCRRCQRVGHASSNCHRPYRCVKCAQNHEIDKCPIIKEADKAALKCANSGNTGHPASYKGCPYLKFASYLIKQTSTKHEALIEQKVNRIYRSTAANLSYANAARSLANTRAVKKKVNFQISWAMYIRFSIFFPSILAHFSRMYVHTFSNIAFFVCL